MTPPETPTWTCSGGSLTLTQGTYTSLIAYLSPGSATVNVLVRDVTLNVPFDIIAPSNIQVVTNQDNTLGWQSGANEVGANTKYLLNILPTTVSFNNVSFRENLPAYTIAWPDKITNTIASSVVSFGYGGSCSGVDTDLISDIVSKSDIYDGTIYENFSVPYSWPDQYLNQSGNWTTFVIINTLTEFNGANLTARQTYQGVPGGWEGPWQ
jgi:hypothetical protein